jgi:V8-like Glu-specific endopeptidase
MEKYIVQFFGFNEDTENKKLLGSAFLVRPHFLITAAHVVLDETGSRYKNKGISFENNFYLLPTPSFIKHKEDYGIDDTIYYDLAIYKINIEISTAFLLSERDVNWNEKFNFFGKGDSEDNSKKIRTKFNATISFNDKYARKTIEGSKMIILQNCFEIKEKLSPGDSGGPIYTNEEVAGMIVYGIKDSNKSRMGCGTVAIKSSFIKSIVESTV